MTYTLKETSSSAMRKLKNQGLTVAEQPMAQQPVLPSDITSVHAEDLMVLFGSVNSWLDYIGVQLAAAEIDEKHEESIADEILAGIQIENKEAKNVTLMKAVALKDKDYQEQLQTVERAYAYRKMVGTVHERLNRQQFLISREITRRQYLRDS